MKRVLFCYLFFLICIFCNAQITTSKMNYTGVEPGGDFLEITNSTFQYTNDAGYVCNGITFPERITISEPMLIFKNFVPFIFSDDAKKIIFLRDDLICICLAPTLVKGLDVPLFIGIKKEAEGQYELTDPHLIKASSALKEGDKVYDASSLWKIRLEHPWSEGAPGLGIGEWLAFRLGSDTDRVGKPIGVYLINGYLSFDHPERYTNNGRIRKMTLTSLKTGMSRQFDVQDTPNPQFFPMEELGGYEFTLTIDEVYPGEKYEDTCVSGILSLNVPWNGPIPEDFYEVSPILKTPR